jgi:hypothetical protein
MEFLKKLFGEGAARFTLQPGSVSTMLDEDSYWSIVAESLQRGDNLEEQEKFLIGILQRLTPEEIVGFRLRTDKLLFDTYTSDMWCAGYIMNGGCSDDSFEYFRNWVISRGRDVFYKAKESPDSLAGQINAELDDYDFEDFWYVALKAFKHQTGKDLYDYIDADRFKFGEGDYPPIDFNWKEDSPESMRAICPMLFDKMWK